MIGSWPSGAFSFLSDETVPGIRLDAALNESKRCPSFFFFGLAAKYERGSVTDKMCCTSRNQRIS